MPLIEIVEMPLTAIEREGLEMHGFDIVVPNHLTDAFLKGVNWALSYNPKLKFEQESYRSKESEYFKHKKGYFSSSVEHISQERTFEYGFSRGWDSAVYFYQSSILSNNRKVK